MRTVISLHPLEPISPEMADTMGAAFAGTFEPADVRILAAAFDSAWTSIRVSGVMVDGNAEAESARTTLAKHIIDAAKQGERDQRRLRDGALLALARENLRHAPRQPIAPKSKARGDG